MIFEEQFPSLKNKTNDEDTPYWDNVLVSDIEKFCLDKRRVRKIISSLEEEWFLKIGLDDNEHAQYITKTLFQELGL